MTVSPLWRRIFQIEFWLLLFPPWGLWLLYKDRLLTRSQKQRVLFYSVVLVVVLTLGIFVLEFNSADKLLTSLGA